MTEVAASARKQWSREEIAGNLDEFDARLSSQRQLAEDLGIPRSTLQHWLQRKETLDADPELVAFFESSVGAAFLHRLILAAHLVMTLVGPCGIRLVCLLLELTGLDHFVAASYGPQQRVAVALEKAVVEFGQAERQRLTAEMRPKAITVCEDETFHPATCLVAIEPVSDFILVEKYAESRTATAWTHTLEQAIAGLAVKVVQSTSDEGKGIVKHVQEDLGAHHSPDLFHVQQELTRGPGVALANQKRCAEQAVAKAVQQVKNAEKAAEVKAEPGLGASVERTEALAQAQQQEAEARQTLETLAAQQERVAQAIQGLSADYHPYDLATGTPRSTEEVASALEQRFADLEAVAAEAHLSDRCLQKIAKAKRQVVAMVATLAFYFLTSRAKVEALAVSPEVERAVYRQLIPAIYLDLAAEKAAEAQPRHTLQKRAAELLAPLNGDASPLQGLTPADRQAIEQVARECAELFQRSSSCVEGRNGQLALRHHSLHRLRDRKLTALTTVHNYFVKRSDGTTAAERFFGSKPRSLLKWILERVDLPGWPAQKRSGQKRKEYLARAVAGA